MGFGVGFLVVGVGIGALVVDHRVFGPGLGSIRGRQRGSNRSRPKRWFSELRLPSQTPDSRRARMPSLREDMVAMTAEGS